MFGCHRLATFLDQLVRNLGSKLGAQEKEQVLQFVQAHFDDDRAKSIAKLIDQPPLRLEHIPGFPSFIGEPAAEQTAGSPITKPVTTTAGMSLDASITLDESFTQFLALLSELSPEVLAHELCAIMCDLMFQLGRTSTSSSSSSGRAATRPSRRQRCSDSHSTLPRSRR